MAILKRGELKLPVLPKQTVPFPVLGGDVVLRALMLSEHLEIISQARKTDTGGYTAVAQALALTVLDADGKALLTAEEWEALGAQHLTDVLGLYNQVQGLSGNDLQAAEKNSEASRIDA